MLRSRSACQPLGQWVKPPTRALAKSWEECWPIRMPACENAPLRPCLRSSLRLRRSPAAASGEWLVSACRVGKDPKKTSRRVRVAVVPDTGSESLKLLPTHFIVSDDHQPVMSYQVIERPAREAMN